jgi:hypothetical protein
LKNISPALAINKEIRKIFPPYGPVRRKSKNISSAQVGEKEIIKIFHPHRPVVEYHIVITRKTEISIPTYIDQISVAQRVQM